MKVTRKMLLIIVAALGVILIIYAAIRHFTGFGAGEAWDRFVADGVIIIALGLFIYNRKMARDEKQARESEEEKHEAEENSDS
ncbi:MAG: hypothetical protein LBH42_00110 [Treponema sp.]|jgi:type VI protein secretion system component VasK|nr:hypothetical protein [Treponema sp.]